MALPTQSDEVKMDYPSRGLPYVEVAAKSGIETDTMDYSSRGLPFVTNDFGAGGAAAIVRSLLLLGAGL